MAGRIQAGSRILHRNVAFNTYGFLNTTEDFAKRTPTRPGASSPPTKRPASGSSPTRRDARLVSEEAKLPLEVARLQLKRNDFSNPVPGAEHVSALKAAAPILVEEDLVRKGTNVSAVIDALVEPAFAKSVVK
jgi:sulfonate transport system substrate-binding protein